MAFKKTRCGICIGGVKAWGVRIGGYGVALIRFDDVFSAAMVSTTNSVRSGSLGIAKKAVKNGIKAIVANSGCANCCTLDSEHAAASLADKAAQALRISPDNVATASTGTIGKPVDLAAAGQMIENCAKSRSGTYKGSLSAAKAIMTTDTTIKMYSATDGEISCGAIAKGAGMIEPSMATMLAFIATDARLNKNKMGDILKSAVDESFNMVSVDGDMSTNDSVILVSTGKKRAEHKRFQKLLTHVLLELAKMIAKDGEGAKRMMEVRVVGAKTKDQARGAAKAVTNSSLFKCSLKAADPNWGRILAAIGARQSIDWKKAGIEVESKVGRAVVMSECVAREIQKAKKVMNSPEVTICIDLGLGKESATAWGCDLTPDYVRINEV